MTPDRPTLRPWTRSRRILAARVAWLLIAATIFSPVAPAWAAPENPEERRESVDSGLARVRFHAALVAEQATPAPKWLEPSAIQEAVRGVRPARAQGGSGFGGGSNKGLVILGIASLGGGAGMLAYGMSESCKTGGPNGTGDCGLGKAAGVAFLGVGALFLALAASDSGGPRASSPPPVYQPPTQVPRAAPAAPVFRNAPASSAAQADIDSIRGGSYGQMPPAQCDGPARGGETVSSYRNDTSYLVSLALAGPTSLSLSIPPGETQTVRIPAGRYEVGARVSAASVQPFYGVQNYGGGQCLTAFYLQLR